MSKSGAQILMTDRFFADELPTNRGAVQQRSPWPIDLARIRPFKIGSTEVRPASCEMIGPDHRESLEPRVMQVLVALAGARGETLSRDELIEACWDGRAVSDDAVNRVMSRLRALARTFGGFDIDTIHKVGYRLVESGRQATAEKPASAERAAALDAPQAKVDRRAVVAAGVAALAAGGGLLAWRKPWGHRPPPEAVDLFQRGEIAHRQGVREQSRWGLNFYEQAVRIDPLYADAWGALALASTQLLESFSERDAAATIARLRSAARRALELDPGNADAKLALMLVRRSFGNWARQEADLVQFNRLHPDHWLGLGRQSLLLYDVGRIEAGISTFKPVLQFDPMLPVGTAYLANAMINTDRLQEADMLLDRGESLWPAHPFLWAVRYNSLIYNGRAEAAAAFVMDPDRRPVDMSPEQVDRFTRLARTLSSRDRSDIQASVRDFEEFAQADAQNLPYSANIFALLGRSDLSFAAWERYFLNQGTFGGPMPIRPHSRRYARNLFHRPMAPLRSDPRFARLLREIGLEDYWRQTGTQPDYRRTG